MATQLLLTAHHHQAMAIACERGMWLPLPLPAEKLPSLFYLAALAPAAEAITALAEIRWFEPWSGELWLPMLGLKTEYQGAWLAWGVGLLMGLLIGALWL